MFYSSAPKAGFYYLSQLRILAVKMKKRMAELNQQLETERNNFSSEKNELQNKLSQLMPKVKLSQVVYGS